MTRLGIVSYSNVAPLHWQLEPWKGCEFVRGVPTALNSMLLAGEIDVTLISSVEFLRHRDSLKALPDFSISSLGTVQSVLLFHWHPFNALDGKRIALTNHSATSVALLQHLFHAEGITPHYETVVPDLTTMLQEFDGALIIGDAALRAYHLYQQRYDEFQARYARNGTALHVTDLGMKWYQQTSLPFTFAVWATREDNPPSAELLQRLRQTRVQGVGNLQAICAQEAPSVGVPAPFLQRYLHNFRYYFEKPDRDALQHFASCIIENFDADSLRFWDY